MHNKQCPIVGNHQACILSGHWYGRAKLGSTIGLRLLRLISTVYCRCTLWYPCCSTRSCRPSGPFAFSASGNKKENNEEKKKIKKTSPSPTAPLRTNASHPQRYRLLFSNFYNFAQLLG